MINARTQFSVPCRQNINLYRLSQITFCFPPHEGSQRTNAILPLAISGTTQRGFEKSRFDRDRGLHDNQ